MNILNIYKKVITPKLINFFKYDNVMKVPKIIKIVINIGIGWSICNKKNLDHILLNLKSISGQKPLVTKARKSIANFKIRQGFPIGCKVTLRKNLMWFFLEKLIYVVIPRIRDFRGFSKKSFDNSANLNIGIKEHTIFPEINYEKNSVLHGLDISIVTSTFKIEESLALLTFLSFPFKN